MIATDLILIAAGLGLLVILLNRLRGAKLRTGTPWVSGTLFKRSLHHCLSFLHRNLPNQTSRMSREIINITLDPQT